MKIRSRVMGAKENGLFGLWGRRRFACFGPALAGRFPGSRPMYPAGRPFLRKPKILVPNGCLILLATLGLGVCLTRLVAAEDEPPRHLTLQEAQQIALKEHPRISIANLTALAAREATRQARAAFFPNVMLNATAVGTTDPGDTRIAAGQLSNPRIYDREAEGISVSQLITDFGRTSELTKSAKLRARARQQNLAATQEQVLLEVNNAYFNSLAAQSVMHVAEQTVQARQTVMQQTQELATNKLKSELDLSFANVDYYQAGLLLVKARSDLKASFAILSTLLADQKPETFVLTDVPMPDRITNDAYALVLEAYQQRPELAQLRYQSQAAQEFARAQGKLFYPSLNGMVNAGVIPAGQDHVFGPDWVVAGVNLSIPIYAGGLYTAEKDQAQFEAQAAQETLRDEEDTISRDVQVTKLNMDYAFDRLSLTQQLLQNANQALTLARARFKAGLSSIVELSQAELNQTQAQIAAADARYDYQTQHSALLFQLGRLR